MGELNGEIFVHVKIAILTLIGEVFNILIKI